MTEHLWTHTHIPSHTNPFQPEHPVNSHYRVLEVLLKLYGCLEAVISAVSLFVMAMIRLSIMQESRAALEFNYDDIHYEQDKNMLIVKIGVFKVCSAGRDYPSSIMRCFKENVAIYCKPMAILSTKNADELLLVLAISFQLDKQKIAFNSMSPENSSLFHKK